MEWLVKLWIKIEHKGIKALGYKLYAIGALFYSFYRFRVLPPMIYRFVNGIQAVVLRVLH